MPTKKYYVCRRSGIASTVISEMPGAPIQTVKEALFLDDIHPTIERLRARCPATILAGGILLALNDCERFANQDKYPITLMGELNAELSLHKPSFLYELYQRVYTFCYGTSVAASSTFNLTQSHGKWGIVHAIKLLIGDPEDIPSNGYIQAANIAASISRQEERRTLTLENAKISSGKLGSMKILDIIKRVKRLANKCKRVDTARIMAIEAKYKTSLAHANEVLDQYPHQAEYQKIAMAKLYTAIAFQFPDIICSNTHRASFESIKRHLLDFDNIPTELKNEGLEEFDWDSL